MSSIERGSQDDRIRGMLTTVFKLTEMIYKDGSVTLNEGKELIGPILEPLVETDYFKIDGAHLIIGLNAPSYENARRLRNQDFCIRQGFI